jgi:hypothetical protein
MMERLEVGFCADDEGMFRLTWGQENFWRQDIRPYSDGLRHNFNLPMVIDLPGGTGPVDQATVTAALRRLVERNQVLRTHFFLDEPDGPVQRVARTGTFTLRLRRSTPEASRADAGALAAELAAATFDHETEWGIRLALVCADQSPRHLVFAISHLAADGGGIKALFDDFFDLLRTQAGGTEPKARWQPSDQVRREQSERGARRSNGSIRHWRKQLQEIPPSMLGAPAGPPAQPRFRQMRFESRALGAAAAHLATSCQVSTASVVMAGTALGLSALTGQATCALLIVTGNRYDESLRSMVGAASQNGLLVVDLSGGTVAEAVRATHRAATATYFYGQYDPGAVEELTSTLAGQRGVRLDLSLLYNDLSSLLDEPEDGGPAGKVPEADARKLAAESVLVPEATWQGQLVKMYLAAEPGMACCRLTLVADTAYLPLHTLEPFLRGIEKIVLKAAYHDVTIASIPALTGLGQAYRVFASAG